MRDNAVPGPNSNATVTPASTQAFMQSAQRIGCAAWRGKCTIALSALKIGSADMPERTGIDGSVKPWRRSASANGATTDAIRGVCEAIPTGSTLTRPPAAVISD